MITLQIQTLTMILTATKRIGIAIWINVLEEVFHIYISVVQSILPKIVLKSAATRRSLLWLSWEVLRVQVPDWKCLEGMGRI